ncbi:hypothetical protein LT493_04525 [Streptomyces tricolor]|nr:hypothetical protein [Streptomyces tricolor]
MDLYRVDPAQVKEASFTTDDWTATLLRCLAHPCDPPEERHGARLRGFLFRHGGALRLYMDSDEVRGVIAADVLARWCTDRTAGGGALTARRRAQDLEEPGDPHCRYLVDLTDW